MILEEFNPNYIYKETKAFIFNNPKNIVLSSYNKNSLFLLGHNKGVSHSCFTKSSKILKITKYIKNFHQFDYSLETLINSKKVKGETLIDYSFKFNFLLVFDNLDEIEYNTVLHKDKKLLLNSLDFESSIYYIKYDFYNPSNLIVHINDDFIRIETKLKKKLNYLVNLPLKKTLYIHQDLNEGTRKSCHVCTNQNFYLNFYLSCTPNEYLDIKYFDGSYPEEIMRFYHSFDLNYKDKLLQQIKKDLTEKKPLITSL